MWGRWGGGGILGVLADFFVVFFLLFLRLWESLIWGSGLGPFLGGGANKKGGGAAWGHLGPFGGLTSSRAPLQSGRLATPPSSHPAHFASLRHAPFFQATPLSLRQVAFGHPDHAPIRQATPFR